MSKSLTARTSYKLRLSKNNPNLPVLFAYEKIIFKELNIDVRFKTIYKDYKNMCKQLYNYLNNKQSFSIEELYKEIQDKIALNPAILDKKYGNPITPNIILSALTTGSLFIRKCYNSSLIETYSDILKNYTYMQENEQQNKVTNKIILKYDYSGY